jgi:hypothetical protein
MATYVNTFTKKRHKLYNHPIGENLPNLVTLGRQHPPTLNGRVVFFCLESSPFLSAHLFALLLAELIEIVSIALMSIYLCRFKEELSVHLPK